MSIKQKMIMRTTIQRQTPEKDNYGHNRHYYTDYHFDVSCYAWEGSEKQDYNATSKININIIKMIISKSIDIKKTDRIQYVNDRLGNELFGKMEILNVILRKDHQQLILRRVS